MAEDNVCGGDKFKLYLEELVRKLQPKELRVGWLQGSTANGLPAPELAAIHNYGSHHNPPRPVFTTFAIEAEAKFGGMLVAALKHTEFDADAAMNTVGMLAKSDLQAKFPWEGGPPLKKETVKRKGFDAVLVDTAALRNAVDYEVADV